MPEFGDVDCNEKYDSDEQHCSVCGGSGWRITCIDDLCYGKEECIHGDDPTPCPECNPKGDFFGY